jgi:hypothetical protein
LRTKTLNRWEEVQKSNNQLADSAAVAGSASPYSGGTVGGSLGSTYDMNKKFWIRWASIALICITYYVIVLYFDLVFALNFSETMSR